jgi:hypothetical protein
MRSGDVVLPVVDTASMGSWTGLPPIWWANTSIWWLADGSSSRGPLTSEPPAECRLRRPCDHPVVLRLSEFALGYRITNVPDIAGINAKFVPREPIACAPIERGESWCQRPVPSVQIAVARELYAHARGRYVTRSRRVPASVTVAAAAPSHTKSESTDAKTSHHCESTRR